VDFQLPGVWFYKPLPFRKFVTVANVITLALKSEGCAWNRLPVGRS